MESYQTKKIRSIQRALNKAIDESATLDRMKNKLCIEIMKKHDLINALTEKLKKEVNK